MEPTVIGFVASIMGIACGMLAVIGGVIAKIVKMKNERMTRQSIIENKIDSETAKLLITPTEDKKRSPYSAMQWGCTLLGLALGYVVTLLLGINENLVGFWIILAAGVGVGLLISFIIKQKLEDKKSRSSQKE
jgi:UPF0716 family protein affecting phage T7 exclusion